jgi:hypothetical protein
VIRHDTNDPPKPKQVYRCHICRLELSLNAVTNRLDVTPLPDRRTHLRLKKTS